MKLVHEVGVESRLAFVLRACVLSVIWDCLQKSQSVAKAFTHSLNDLASLGLYRSSRAKLAVPKLEL